MREYIYQRPKDAIDARRWAAAGLINTGSLMSTRVVKAVRRLATTLTGMDTIELYTRPGCQFCLRLRRRLGHQGIELREINIRRDAGARARVREAGNCGATVPTVRIGARWLVNFTINDIAAQPYQAEMDNGSIVLASVVAHGSNLQPVPPAGPAASPSEEDRKQRAQTPHRVHALTHAAHAIRRYRTNVVTRGTPGIVVDVHSAPRRTTYTVEFHPEGLAGATIRVPGLTDADLQALDPPEARSPHPAAG